MFDADMNCDETEGGWFEVKGFVTNGAGWEGDIHQGACQGDAGGTPSYQTTNHMARCGYVNVFSWGDSSCEINNF